MPKKQEEKKITLEERIEALKAQLKQLEATHLKIQGAIEVLEGMQSEEVNS
jgi:prefoldin subunit 5|tara:strand:+ start:2401 stop:2553 length:153 start_codon:yes stop_codon:yes gene_type:complete